MAKDEIQVKDETKPDITEGNELARKEYVVTSESGLFKNGKQYKPGSVVELDEDTAGRFIELGEVEVKE